MQYKKQLITQKLHLESNTIPTTTSDHKATSLIGDKEKIRKKSNTIGLRTRSLSQNLQQIFQPFQRGANAQLRASTQSIPNVDKESSSSKSSFSFGISANISHSHRSESAYQISHSSTTPIMTHRNVSQHFSGNKLNRLYFYRRKSISSPYVQKALHAQRGVDRSKQLITKAITENNFLVQTVQNHLHHGFTTANGEPIYEANDVKSTHSTRHHKFIKSSKSKPFFSRQNSIEEHQNVNNCQTYSQSYDNLLANDFKAANQSRKKYSKKTKSSACTSVPSKLSLPFGGSCGNLNVPQQKFPHDQSIYRTIHGTSVSSVPTQLLRPTILKSGSARLTKPVIQLPTNEYSNSDTFDEYDRTSDGSITDSSSSSMSFDMNLPSVPLKQSSSLSSVPNIQRKPFRSQHGDRFTRMQSLDFSQSQTNVPLMMNKKMKKSSRTVPHSRTGSPLSSPIQSRAATPTYFELDVRQQQQQHYKTFNHQQCINSGVNLMTSYGNLQTGKLNMPMINLPKKSSSMSTMVAPSSNSLISGTSLSNIEWQSPLVRHCFNFY